MMILPLLLYLLISCGGDGDYIEEIHTLYEEDTKIVYDTVYRAGTDSAGNEITDTIISERTETVRNDLKITIDSLNYIFSIIGAGSMQGADCYNNLIFQFCDKFKHAYCYDITNGNRVALFHFSGAPDGYNYHCNNADFSDTFYYEDDEFPLIYISQNAHRHVVVCRIVRTSDSFSLDVVQTIVFKDIYSLDIALDNENGLMYNYAATSGNNLRLLKYKIPDYRLPGEVTLTKEDILDTLDIAGYISDYQGAKIKDGLFYFAEGVPNWGSEPCIRIVNLENGSYSRYNLTKLFGFYYELEDVFFYNNELYCTTNFGKGVYKVCLNYNR